MLIFVVQWTRIWNDYHFPCAGFTHRYISQRNSACYLLAYEFLHWSFLIFRFHSAFSVCITRNLKIAVLLAVTLKSTTNSYENPTPRT